ncbi:hypothetical protein ABIE44_000821 [Marmoricola sp. OAE513]|uniref:hypothetical protein n=1 Tax=Marmoricola sp. OAE513 TaxID=2817894 RepID=UPI00339817D4
MSMRSVGGSVMPSQDTRAAPPSRYHWASSASYVPTACAASAVRISSRRIRGCSILPIRPCRCSQIRDSEFVVFTNSRPGPPAREERRNGSAM